MDGLDDESRGERQRYSGKEVAQSFAVASVEVARMR